jgi:hypothetical protein
VIAVTSHPAKPEEPEEVRRIDENLPRLTEASLAPGGIPAIGKVREIVATCFSAAGR